MKCTSKIIKDVMVVDIEGDIMGGVESEQFQTLIYNAVEQDTVKIVINMANANWINSSGLGMLISGMTTARSSDGDLKLANVSERIRRPLEITRLDTIFSIYSSVDEAVESFE